MYVRASSMCCWRRAWISSGDGFAMLHEPRVQDGSEGPRMAVPAPGQRDRIHGEREDERIRQIRAVLLVLRLRVEPAFAVPEVVVLRGQLLHEVVPHLALRIGLRDLAVPVREPRPRLEPQRGSQVGVAVQVLEGGGLLDVDPSGWEAELLQAI